MDTNLEAIRTPVRRGPYRHHPLEFKRAVVEETLQPGASVALVARKRGVNANQVFHWRKLYREGLLGDASPAMLPVTIEQNATVDRANVVQSSGSLLIESDRLRVRIEGRPDAETLRVVLAELRRP
jgi:transposase